MAQGIYNTMSSVWSGVGHCLETARAISLDWGARVWSGLRAHKWEVLGAGASLIGIFAATLYLRSKPDDKKTPDPSLHSSSVTTETSSSEEEEERISKAELVRRCKTMTPHGLFWTNNNCFLNAMFQLVMHTRLLPHAIEVKAVRPYIHAYAEGEAVNLNGMRAILRMPKNGQQDVDETLKRLLDEMNTATRLQIFRRPKNSAPISSTTQNLSELTGSSGLPSQPEIKTMLEIPLPESVHTIQEAMNAFFRKSTHECEVKFKIGGQPHQANIIEEQSALPYADDFLLVTLLRFDNQGRKITREISAENGRLVIKINQEDARLCLKGFIIQHSNSTGEGHYTSVVNINDNWWRFNDTIAKKIEEQEALGLANIAYVFYYERERDEKWLIQAQDDYIRSLENVLKLPSKEALERACFYAKKLGRPSYEQLKHLLVTEEIELVQPILSQSKSNLAQQQLDINRLEKQLAILAEFTRKETGLFEKELSNADELASAITDVPTGIEAVDFIVPATDIEIGKTSHPRFAVGMEKRGETTVVHLRSHKFIAAMSQFDEAFRQLTVHLSTALDQEGSERTKYLKLATGSLNNLKAMQEAVGQTPINIADVNQLLTELLKENSSTLHQLRNSVMQTKQALGTVRSNKEQAEATMETSLAKRGEIVEVADDGHCLFAALTEVSGYQGDLRAEVAKRLEEKVKSNVILKLSIEFLLRDAIADKSKRAGFPSAMRAKFDEVDNVDQYVSGAGIEDYIEALKKDGFGGDIEIAICREILGENIAWYMPGEGTPKLCGNKGGLYLIFYPGGTKKHPNASHWNGFKPKSNPFVNQVLYYQVLGGMQR